MLPVTILSGNRVACEALRGAPHEEGARGRAQELAKAGFDRCLVTDAEPRLGAEGWRALADPFPAWGEGSVEADAAQVA